MWDPILLHGINLPYALKGPHRPLSSMSIPFPCSALVLRWMCSGVGRQDCLLLFRPTIETCQGEVSCSDPHWEGVSVSGIGYSSIRAAHFYPSLAQHRGSMLERISSSHALDYWAGASGGAMKPCDVLFGPG